MANYKAVATGNWSNLATWQDDGGGSYVASTVLPGVGDVVYANGFTVTIDINVTVAEIRTNSATNVIAGGLFDFGAGTSLTGNVFAGSTTAIRNNTTSGKVITGNVTATSGNSAFGALNNTTGTLTINGNITAGSGNEAVGVRNAANGTVIVNGNAVGGTFSSAPGVQNNSTGTLTVNGNVTGGSGNVCAGADNASTGVLTVNGVATGGTGTTCPGARNVSSGTLRVTTAQGGVNQTGVLGSLSTGTTIVANVVWASNGRIPLEGFVKFDNTAAKSVTVVLESGATELLTDNSVVNYPAEADVRAGVQYGNNNIFTGTLPVSGLTAADVWNYALSNGFAAGSIGESLAGVRIRTDKIPDFPASVQTTGDQIASFEV